MQFIELEEKDKPEYNRFVINNESCSFLQSWDWGEWQQSLGREVKRFFLTDDKEVGLNDNDNESNVVGTAQFIKMPLPFGWHYWYCPYGPLAVGENFQFFPQSGIPKNIGTIFPAERDPEEHRDNFQSIFKEAVFVRIEPKSRYWELSTEHLTLVKSHNIQPQKTLLIDLSKTEEQLLAEMHHKTRYNIRLAKKKGVRVESELIVTPGHGLYFQEAVDLILQTAKRQGYKGYGREYYNGLVDHFSLHSGDELSGIKITIYKALKDRDILASAIMLDFGNTRTYLFGGSSEEQKEVMAPYALHFQAMLDGKQKNIHFYDFWGLETSAGKTSGFARFKKGFGGFEKEYAGAYDVVLKKPEYRIYKILRKIKNFA